MKNIAIEKLKEFGVEIWMETPEDENPIMITFGTFRKILESLVPDGHAVVPVEPTDAMYNAMGEVLYGHTRAEAISFAKLDKFMSNADNGVKAYNAALAARGK